jgi:hypothetical protein
MRFDPTTPVRFHRLTRHCEMHVKRPAATGACIVSAARFVLDLPEVQAAR